MRKQVPHPDKVLEKLLPARPTARSRSTLQLTHALLTDYCASGNADFARERLAELAVRNGFGKTHFVQSKGPVAALLRAHRDYANAIELPHEGHPNATLRQLLQKDGATGARQLKLRRLGTFLEKWYGDGNRDFSIGTIVAAWGQRGGEPDYIRGNDAGARLLLDAWNIYAHPHLASRAMSKLKSVESDLALDWCRAKYPHLEDWRVLAERWLRLMVKGLVQKIAVIRKFFSEYLAAFPQCPSPARLLAKGSKAPPFDLSSIATKGRKGYLSVLVAFIDWVLIKEFSLDDDDGHATVSPAFRNPFKEAFTSAESGWSHVESVLSPLPYAYIEELRQTLCEGPNFKDWKFAQDAVGPEEGVPGRANTCWFEVPKSRIDPDDPDCVWRERVQDGRKIFELWEPVRWVCLLLKLTVPLRTGQSRVLDSGESDAEKFDGSEWVKNNHPLASDSSRQGVLQRPKRAETKIPCVLYINTNKTADDHLLGAAKGYRLPWYTSDELSEDVYYWLRKIRAWQEKYNPVHRLTSWSELERRHVGPKSEAQLARYLPTCFLFRSPTDANSTHLPITDGKVKGAWDELLYCFQKRLAKRGEEVVLVTMYKDKYPRALFPLHSLRVSLITALVLDGKVPLNIMAKLVGHSRTKMTDYYTKLTEARIERLIEEGTGRLKATREEALKEFLKTSSYEALERDAIVNEASGLRWALAESPSARNPAGWMLMYHGACLMGGNTEAVEGEPKVGGCHNGGPMAESTKTRRYMHVPGGKRNCIRCRWFVTRGYYLPQMVDHFNVVAYRSDEAWLKAAKVGAEVQELRRARQAAEDVGQPFLKLQELKNKERASLAALTVFNELAHDLVACFRLVEACWNQLHGEDGEGSDGGGKLIPAGASEAVKLTIQETASELFQLSGVCEVLEVCEDLTADAAVLRRSQLVDAALMREGAPAFFMKLTPEEQLKAGNAMMRTLAKNAHPTDEKVGMRKVIQIMDAGQELSKHLGVTLKSTLNLPTDRRQKKSPKVAGGEMKA